MWLPPTHDPYRDITFQTVEIAKLIPEYLRAVISWPLVAIVALLLFQRQIRRVVDHLIAAIERIRQIDVAGITVVLERLKGEVVPKEESKKLELTVSTGAYSTDHRGVFLEVGIANRTDESDQVLEWKLSFEAERAELTPTRPRANLLTQVPWWDLPTADIPANKFVQGTLFFPGSGLAACLNREPVLGRLTARTFHRHELSSDVKVYLMTTLQKNPNL
ncbi:MAG TPA: hypothetical protein VIY69_04775 [Candidatus Acidoferrales bacterium]